MTMVGTKSFIPALLLLRYKTAHGSFSSGFSFYSVAVAELGSDEDDIDEEGQEYLEMLARQAGEDGDDEDWEEDDAEETALEGYTTSVDDEDNLVDEYQIFKAILQSKRSEIAPFNSENVSAFHENHSSDVLSLQTPRPATQHGTRH